MILALQSRLKYLLFLLFHLFTFHSFSIVPHPNKVVVVVLENHAYHQIVGSSAAPYINSLIADSLSATFTESYGLTHPSQPNYVHMFAGGNLGVTNNQLPSGVPFTSPNLGGYLLNASRTFIGYSEDLPSTGSLVVNSGGYARKHSPWVHWQNAPVNGIPPASNRPFSDFPTDYNLLPDVAFIIPNLDNDMHDGTDPGRITRGDTWLFDNLDGYVQWCKTNNSIFIITFDEDDNLSGQRVLTLFVGQMVKPGFYSNYLNHHHLLRTLEDMFDLPYAGNSANVGPIDYCWNDCANSARINPPGPVYFCQGDSITLTATPGSSYLWSNGDTATSITVSSSGTYSVTITDANNCTSTSTVAEVHESASSSFGLLFNETMGTIGGTVSISDHELANNFDNDNFTMSGTGDLRSTLPSSNYPSASGGANVFLTNTAGRNFIISDINTSGLSELELSFGVYKNRTLADGSDFIVQVSTDGINYTTLSYALLPTGTGTAVWHHRTTTGLIPSTPNLRIQFIQTNVINQYRIDDVMLKYATGTSSISISASGPVTFCHGDSVTLSATPAASYLWSNGETSQEIIASVSGYYSVVGTLVSGCQISSNFINVHSVPTVHPTVSIISDIGNSICAGDNVTFTAYPTFCGPNPIYQWKENGIVVGVDSNRYSNNALLPNDVITCTVIGSVACAASNVTTSNSISMTLNFNVTPEVSISNNWADTLCSGDVAIFTATPVFGGSSPSYQWKRNGNNVGTNSSTYTTTSLSHGDVVTCEMTSSATCASPSTAQSNSNLMLVYSTSNPSLSISQMPGGAICAGAIVTFTASAIEGGPSPIFQWKKNGNNTGTNSDTYITSALADGDTISCVMISSAQCAIPANALSNDIFIDITTGIAPSVSIVSGSGNSICSGAIVTFNATPSDAGATPSYQWKKNGINVGTNSTSYTTSSIVNGDIITCEITSSESCAVPLNATSNSITMTVMPNVVPSVNINASPGINVCAGTSVSFTANALNGGSSPSFLWKINGINVGSNSNIYSSNQLVNGDQVSCFITSNETCVSPTGVTSNVIVMNVSPIVTPSVNISANSMTFCSNSNSIFTATPINGGQTPVYQWEKNGTIVGTNSNTYSDNSLQDNDVIQCIMTSNSTCIAGNTATSNQITITITPLPVFDSFSPTAAFTGLGITLNGNNLLSVISVSFNGVQASFSFNSNTQLTAFVPSGATSGNITLTNACGTVVSSLPISLNSSSLQLDLKMFIEGYYLGGGQMIEAIGPGFSDTVTVELRANTSPYQVVYISKGVINSGGNGNFNFPLSVDGTSFYIVVYTHNTLKTWSATAIQLHSSISYDFTDGMAKAFGNNLKDLGDGNFALFSGDVTQDGVINLVDLDEVKTTSQLFSTGYMKEDLTGDKIVESADFSIIENNRVVITIHP